MTSHSLVTTFAASAALGVSLMVLAARLRISAIVVLLIGGILAGPEFLGIVNPDALGGGLNAIISIAVSIILFEGGLTLDVNGYREVSKEIWGVLTKGLMVTWLASALCIYLVFDFSFPFCMLAASLIIVTGPTVIGPLLHRIRVNDKLNHILHWEGVLIDPIGVFCALLCFEFYVSMGTNDVVILDFFLRFAYGAGVGIFFGMLLVFILKRSWVPEEYLNIFVVAFAIVSFAVADSFKAESGLLSVTLAGLFVGYKRPPGLNKIIEYKVELKDMMIGLLFVLLAANLELHKFLGNAFKLSIVVCCLMFLVRPLNIFVSTFRSASLALREKLFLCWIAPRGIVAASMASIFAVHLKAEGANSAEADFLEIFTYSVIAATVVFQGFTAKWVAKILNVVEPTPKGWMILGAHDLSRVVAKFLKDRGQQVVVLDTNPRKVQIVKRDNITAICDNAMLIDPENRMEFIGVGNVLAVTSNSNLNALLCQRWKNRLSKATLYRWDPDNAPNQDPTLTEGSEKVWTKVQLKQLPEHGIEQDCRITDVDLEDFDQPDLVIMSEQDGKLYPGLPEGLSGKATLLTIKPVKDDGPDLPVRKDWVVFSDEAELEPLYVKLLDLVEQSSPGLDKPPLLEELIQREEEFTSLIGHGIALPHAHAAGLKEPLMLVVRINPGIPCKHTGSNIDLIFMLLSPKEQPVEHLNLISKIAKFIMVEEARIRMMEAETAEDLYEVVKGG